MLDVHLNQYFLIVITDPVQNATLALDDIFNVLWTNSLLNSNVLIQEERQYWTLYTYIPFRTNCFSLDPVILASFTPYNCTANMTMSMFQLYPEKLTDFKRCPIYVAPTILDPFAMAKEVKGKLKYTGIDISIIKEISQALNFVAVFTPPSNQSLKEQNDTITPNMAMVMILYFNSRFFQDIFVILKGIQWQSESIDRWLCMDNRTRCIIFFERSIFAGFAWICIQRKGSKLFI